ncbi:hypothetical protein Thein_0505 [Thermodesulfatator indicus DSM 15286]|uniref:Uncharacterized protein n=1 Tax=Thermodesulfatator indicus (strain DSM 15286 / JCM 11887 / CIR29812) TaxID=667014 RepID=F8AB21_THEID|nr:hypothetical protein [Thermodesulfatator indicus]AEH44387.1 hypothetical protein Thein_0505 [Thermodesulfatator indicus DSM 15286]
MTMFEIQKIEKIKKDIENIQIFLEDWEDLQLLLEAEEKREREEIYSLEELKSLLEEDK